MGIVSEKLRNSARGQPCTVRLDCCNRDPDTTVLAHLRGIGDGMGTKPSDWHAVFACSDCHTAIDQHLVPKAIRSEILLLALKETQQRWFEMGLLQVPVTEKRKPTSSKILPRRDMRKAS